MNKKIILIGLMALMLLLVACTQDYGSGAAYAQSQPQIVGNGCAV